VTRRGPTSRTDFFDDASLSTHGHGSRVHYNLNAVMNTRSRITRSGGAQAGHVQALPQAVPSLGRSFGFLFTSAAVSRGVPFLVNVAVAHKLTPQEYGVPTVHFALVSNAPDPLETPCVCINHTLTHSHTCPGQHSGAHCSRGRQTRVLAR
jgi:hypothetical protein